MVTDHFVAFERVYEELNPNMPTIGDQRKYGNGENNLPFGPLRGITYRYYDRVYLQILEDIDLSSLANTFSRVLRVSQDPLVIQSRVIHDSDRFVLVTRGSFLVVVIVEVWWH